MKFLDHIKLAGYTGLVLGMIIGTIDIIARIIKMWFKWYEFYQTLFISFLLVMLCFIILALFIELLKKIIKFRISKSFLSRFYIMTSIFLILLFYGEIFINKYLPFFNAKTIPRLSTQIDLLASFIYLLIIFSIYIVLLIKKNNLILSLKTNNNVNKFIKNYIFIVIVFVVFSFFMDLYLINNVTTSFTTKEEIKNLPNVLIITLDAVRTDHLSLYGYPLSTTPNLDKFAEKAVVFENAISSCSWTLPTHSSIFTGKYPFNHNATKINQKLDNKETTLAEILKEKGYNTVGFIGGAPFLDTRFGAGQGFLVYKDRIDFLEYGTSFNRFSITNIIYMFFPNMYKFIFNVDGKRTSEEINKDIFKWLDKNKNKQPFFMFINYFDAIYYNAPQKLDIKLTNKSIPFKEVDKIIRLHDYSSLSKDTINNLIALYDNGIFYLDYNLGDLFDKFNELKILDNTIIIITADHGEEFYEHKSFAHGGSLYEESIHVPLIIYYPKKLEPKKIEKRIETMNIFSTILDLLKIEQPQNIDSISLLPLIKGQDYKREYTFSELWKSAGSNIPKDEAISYKNWKLIKKIDQKGEISFELYNLEEDQKEQNNIYNKQLKEAELLKGYLNNITKKI